MVEIVQDALLYHVHRKVHSELARESYGVGTQWNSLDGRTNPWTDWWEKLYYRASWAGTTDGLPPLAALAWYRQQSEPFRAENRERLLTFLEAAISDQARFLRETVLEDIRRNEFPDRPSRRSCIWLVGSTALPYWWNTLAQERDCVYAVRATGKVFRADDRLLPPHELIALSMLREGARSYWQGISDRGLPTEEILFEGVLELLGRYEKLDECLAAQESPNTGDVDSRLGDPHCHAITN